MPQLPVSLPALAAALMLLAPPSAMAADRKPESAQQAAPKQAARHAPSRPAEPQFVAGIGDLPLMPGLSPVPEQDVVFDKPAGRIVQAVAHGPVKPADVSRFYAQTVPQLGWHAVGGGSARTLGRFEREGEVLELEQLQPPSNPGQVTVRFTLMPR